MLFIAHRANTIELLKLTSQDFGIEIDIRSFGTKLVLNHDPFLEGIDFNDWLSHYTHSFLILNVKEEGLEKAISQILAERGVFDFFYLDQSFPSMIRYIRDVDSRVAARVSELECVDTAIATGASWAWLDSHSGNWKFLESAVPKLKFRGVKVCLVSPELQGRFDLEEYATLLAYCSGNSIDAVCSKFPEAWKTFDLGVIQKAIMRYQSSIS